MLPAPERVEALGLRLRGRPRVESPVLGGPTWGRGIILDYVALYYIYIMLHHMVVLGRLSVRCVFQKRRGMNQRNGWRHEMLQFLMES